MPRIRTIKPEFWGDEKLAPLAPIDRLVFLGLICMADDAGRVVDSLKSIDGFLFPDTADSSRESLDILASISRVYRYKSESGQPLIQIANWQKHQRVDKASKYTLPAPRESLASVSRDARVSTYDPDLRPTTLTMEEEHDLPPANGAPPSPPSIAASTTVAPRNVLSEGQKKPRSITGAREQPHLEVESAPDTVSAFVSQYPFDRYASHVEGFLRSSAHPDAVMGVLRSHLDGMGEPQSTALVVGRALVEYAAANGVERGALRANLFAGMVRGVIKRQHENGNRARNTTEQKAIDRERDDARRREAEARVVEQMVERFASDQPERYAELLLTAERRVPPSITLGRAEMVRGILLTLVREAVRA